MLYIYIYTITVAGISHKERWNIHVSKHVKSIVKIVGDKYLVTLIVWDLVMEPITDINVPVLLFKILMRLLCG